MAWRALVGTSQCHSMILMKNLRVCLKLDAIVWFSLVSEGRQWDLNHLPLFRCHPFFVTHKGVRQCTLMPCKGVRQMNLRLFMSNYNRTAVPTKEDQSQSMIRSFASNNLSRAMQVHHYSPQCLKIEATRDAV